MYVRFVYFVHLCAIVHVGLGNTGSLAKNIFYESVGAIILLVIKIIFAKAWLPLTTFDDKPKNSFLR